MKIKTLEINNFRALDHLEIDLGSRLTLLVGENGTGKTSVLDALSIGLGAVLSYLPQVTGFSFKNTDITQTDNGKAPYTRVKITVGKDLVWDRTLRRDKSSKTSEKIPNNIGLTQLKQYVEQGILNPFNDNIKFQLPVFSYYGVSRALLDVPLRRRGFPKNHQQFEALHNSLNSSSRFKSSFVWFYNKENEEQRKQKELRDFDYVLPELEVVRKAITTVFPDISEPHIMLNPLRFAVRFKGKTLDIMQLSDGYKTLLSLVIDLASRMALANPHMGKESLEAPAIVMIDEVDLHLHPEWQRRVIGDLLRTFPNTQFIFTTHSPYIVESVNNHLMRFHIQNENIEDKKVIDTLAINPDDVEAYYFVNNQITNMKDPDLLLFDNNLINSFNAISELYDSMRDIQWEGKE